MTCLYLCEVGLLTNVLVDAGGERSRSLWAAVAGLPVLFPPLGRCGGGAEDPAKSLNEPGYSASANGIKIIIHYTATSSLDYRISALY